MTWQTGMAAAAAATAGVEATEAAENSLFESVIMQRGRTGESAVFKLSNPPQTVVHTC